MISLIDPSVQDHVGTPSTNLGDVVIFRAIARYLSLLLPDETIHRISSHQPLLRQHHEAMQASRLVVFGGSNLLSSDLLEYNQWNFAADRSDYDKINIDNGVLFGVGWWQYQGRVTNFTSQFYKRVLSEHRLHSVRDGYTAAKLGEAGIANVVNTGCPSMWGLGGMLSNRQIFRTEDCLLMLTDYYTNPREDEALVQLLLRHFEGTIFYFPQGTGDIDYLRTLPSFCRNERRFEILNHSLASAEALMTTRSVTFVGTRLHGGILALNHKVPSLITGVDNRSIEMARDFNLPVIPRKDRKAIGRWLRGEDEGRCIRVPKDEIVRWCRNLAPSADPATVLSHLKPESVIGPPITVKLDDPLVTAQRAGPRHLAD